MALNLLLVDPDDKWLASAKKFFEENFYNVKVANNGKSAQLLLYNEKFFGIVLNVLTERHNGLQVLKFIKTNHPSLKVIMTADQVPEEEIDSEDALTPDRLKKMGATDVMVRPFELEGAKKALEGHQSVVEMVAAVPKRKGQSEEEEVDAQDEKFTKLNINEFYTSQALLFDIYIKLKSNRFLKILHAGDTFSKERIDHYKTEKNVEWLYFEKKEAHKYVKYNNHFAKKIMGNSKIKGDKKVKLMQNISEKFLEQAFTEGMKPQIIDQGKEICENMFEMVQKQEDLYKVLRDYQDFDPQAFTHAYLTTIFSTSIIKQFEWQSRTTIECTAMACLFHDIGMMKCPEEIRTKKFAEMDDAEKAEYFKHPEYGLELIDGNSMINNSVKQIILQHHEHFDGTGFPFAKRGSKILTLSNIVCLANDFTNIIQDEDLKPVEALKKFLQNRQNLTWYNSLIVENLIKVFVNPEAIVKENKLPSNSRMVASKKAS